MENLPTLRTYYCLIVEQYLKEKFPGKAQVYSDKFKKIFEELIDSPKNSQFFGNKTANLHAINPIFVIAFSKAIEAENYQKNQIQSMIMEIYKIMVKPLLDKQLQSMKNAKIPWKHFIEITKNGNHKLYENEYFQVEYVVEDRLRFGFNINRCYYFDIFKANNQERLASILCQYDNLLAENLNKWVRFQRNSTIAEGNSKCEFRYFRNI
ncbi:MAG: L-2-amino-thiazoline-4-carboxylic acid hydrolase [Candidatus Lokiarchaeota archaeon]|nr:L-2-amino-thiazoline-4-carboxylic acid hydrolase [Candidatus Harpocratesius repetitus]